ncbi:hypothetical protein D2N39_04650 [Gemmobacter lutimaris]|uniref:Uncharacterized protein n=1 Tax=Gemmobacter lutimaris TaxID=2306023 RepID=A0A398BTE5_9RHOB|nr:hypothetical protein [Gemmobacter lutimaris]RID92954.1 hypothetical protein D2N39_04650 [Gemmobacter lutimaris]
MTQPRHRGRLSPQTRFALTMMAALAVMTALTLSALPGQGNATTTCKLELSEPAHRACDV